MPRTLADDPQKPIPATPATPGTTVATVGQPGPVVEPPMKPMQSTTIKSLIFVGLAQIVLALLPMFQAKAFDLWTLGTQLVPVVAGILIRMASGDVQAPAVINAMSFGLLNASNPNPKPKV